MSPKPHSKTVRGTLDNPKTQEAIKSGTKPPQLGDPVSLKPEGDNPPTPDSNSSSNTKSSSSESSVASDTAAAVTDLYKGAGQKDLPGPLKKLDSKL
ncbi:hypothetical protein P153DRAFT_363408 [Dothidotthia symphoricarpi CBS 119687]|uniref:Uncharacterized protein n=1 Tax=Dothidotthia symphoricarpi CBS 119687 TaxID=1392245 RepID=A0A6A6AQS7_9PLEO|nr:uncharacterized protein P153DRAFT_363408 [Dothidotthia symphoricarpi CBS 119687]KAF2133197.1 hypothetical protein P153DRAFT_363408 [Dothidotthia symphoricarpi CBS 119687]